MCRCCACLCVCVRVDQVADVQVLCLFVCMYECVWVRWLMCRCCVCLCVCVCVCVCGSGG